MSNRSLQREMSFFGTVFTMLEESDAALRFDIFALVRLQSPLDTKLLARRMDDVLRNFSRWRSVIVPYGKGAYLWKEVPGFTAAHNIEERYQEKDAMAYRAQLMNSPRLDREARPPWRFYILDDGKAMVVQTHHALGDGSSLLQMLVDLCGSESSVVMPISSRVNNSSKWSLVSVLRFLYLCMTAFYHCVIFPVVGRDDTQTQIQRLDLAAQSRVHVVPMELPLSSLKMHGYSVNDILTAAIVGALRRYLDSFPEHPSVNTSSPTSSSFHALMPINLRGLSASKRIQEGNKISILTVPCPIDKGSVGGRLADVARTMSDLKASPEAHMNLWINTQAFKWFSRAYMLQKAKELYRHASFCFSNVPGPSKPVSICGAEINSIDFAMHPTKSAVFLGAISYCSVVRLNVCCTEGLSAERLADLIQSELDHITQCA